MFKDEDEKREIDVSMSLYGDERNRRNRGEEGQCLPMCHPCKTKNYTSSYCRERGIDLAHQYLPWNSIYVDMSLATDNKDDKDKEPARRNTTSQNHGTEGNTFIHTNDRYQYNENLDADTFFDNIDSSRTFFVQISSKFYKIQVRK